MPDPNPIYDFLKANGLTDKDEVTFLKEYSDSTKAKELHEFFTANKLTDKDFNGFYGEYLKKKNLPHLAAFQGRLASFLGSGLKLLSLLPQKNIRKLGLTNHSLTEILKEALRLAFRIPIYINVKMTACLVMNIIKSVRPSMKQKNKTLPSK
jgi:hypothetical protein